MNQKTVVFIVPTVRTWNLKYYFLLENYVYKGTVLEFCVISSIFDVSGICTSWELQQQHTSVFFIVANHTTWTKKWKKIRVAKISYFEILEIPLELEQAQKNCEN